MSEPPFVWDMTAATHEAAIRRLRGRIINANQANGVLEIDAIVSLLPIQSSQEAELRSRGPFKFRQGHFESHGDPLNLVVSDPAMGSYTIALPQRWAGKINVAADKITLSFDPPLECEIPGIRERNTRRSKFQALTGIVCDTDVSTTTLQDMLYKDGALPLLSLVRVAITRDGDSYIRSYNVEAGGVRVFDEDNCFQKEPPPSDPEAPNRIWYVFVQNNRDGICQVSKQTAYPGFWRLAGPMSAQEAEDLKRTSEHCDAFSEPTPP